MKKFILFASFITTFSVMAAGKGEAVLDPAKAGPDSGAQPQRPPGAAVTPSPGTSRKFKHLPTALSTFQNTKGSC